VYGLVDSVPLERTHGILTDPGVFGPFDLAALSVQPHLKFCRPNDYVPLPDAVQLDGRGVG
jgi:hypothetical protein